MLYPKLKVLKTSREMIDAFGGYNHNLRIGDGELYKMTNLSSHGYPVLCPRPQRSIYAAMSGTNYGLIAKDALCYTDGKYFCMNQYRVDLGLNDEPKQLISMGAYVIILPDKKYINTQNIESDFGNIEQSNKSNGAVTLELCNADGEAYTDVIAQPSDPSAANEPKDTSGDDGEGDTASDGEASLKDQTLWLDTSEKPYVLKRWSAKSELWITVGATYVKISSTSIGKGFSAGDGVTLSGVTAESASHLNGNVVIYACDADSITLEGMLNNSAVEDKEGCKLINSVVLGKECAVCVSRGMPDMDFVIESGNRLWGCKYGMSGGTAVNEIYASKLGDFKNWNCFAGISTDSYTVTVGTDGQFTGAITHLGYPVFFKEGYMHKIYGSYPSNYQVQTTACRGVQKGSGRSLAIVNETLYYKSRSGICAYDGSLPTEISSALGDISYSDAVGGALNNKYYVSMKEKDGAYSLFVYDTSRGMWHREDKTHALVFCQCRGELYYVDAGSYNIKTVLGSEGVPDTTPVEWEAVSGIMGTDSPDKKYISRLDVRMLLPPSSTVSFYAEYDSSGVYEHLHTMVGMTLHSFSVPVRPRRCDHLRLCIKGRGDAKIYSICRTLTQGSDT